MIAEKLGTSGFFVNMDEIFSCPVYWSCEKNGLQYFEGVWYSRGMSQRLVRYIYYMLSNDTGVDRRS